MNNSDKKKIIFYAPIGNLIKGFKNGGAEAGCKKTMAVLQKAGYEIILVEKPPRKSHTILGGFLFIFTLIKVWFVLIATFIKNKESVFHVAGFYRSQIYYEWLLIRSARAFGIKTIYELRNGGMIEIYESYSSIYQWFMKSVLVNSTTILCQGYEYVIFLKDRFYRDSVYYPNYIMDNFISDNSTERTSDPIIRLIYFGRVVADKNIEFIIDVCQKLTDRKTAYSLDIIGGYEEAYKIQLSKKVTEYQLNDREVRFHGRMDFNDIYMFLKKSHFFIFPSKEKREGHSNALTEAMGCGVVPIVSEAGFNESIVGNSELVLSDFDASLYATKIIDIWKSGKWATNSDDVYNRIVENFTESVVKNSLLTAYKNLFGD